MKALKHVDGRTFKMGRKRPLARGPRLKFGRLLASGLVPAPPTLNDYVRGASAPIYASMEDILGNDQYGDCTCAGAGHILDVLRANSAAASLWRPATRLDALAFYSRVTDPPFDPVTGANDSGADEQTVLNVWKQNGFFADGTGKIAAYAAVDPTDIEEIKQAIWLNGNVYFGVGLPDAWVSPMPSKSGFVWDVDGDSDPNNGHCFIGYGYNDQGVFIDTWGTYGTVTWAAVAAYCAAAVGGDLFTVFGPDWINTITQKSPSGFNATVLEQYIQELS